jgi:ankyrin repeat protein
MFCNIDNDLIEDARRILTLLCFAYRPLTTQELIDGIAVDTCGRTGLNRSRKLQDVDDIREICSGFVDIDFIEDPTRDIDTIGDVTPTVQIAHFSVQEYLESARILQSKAAIFHIDSPSAHVKIAQVCLIYLLEEGLRSSHFDKHLVERFPFSNFAAMYWHRHYRDTAASANELEALVPTLFQNRQAFITWVRLHDVDNNWDNRINFDLQPDKIATPIYYASLLGLEQTLSILISEQSNTAIFEQVNTQGGRYGNALQAASYGGYQDLVQFLLDKGADVNAQDGYFGNALRAASHEGYRNIVQLLLDKGADINAQGGRFGNALQAASYGGSRNVVQFLIDKGADINAQGGHFGSALRAALCAGNSDLAVFLIGKGANIGSHNGHLGNVIQGVSGYPDFVGFLSDEGADINAEGGLCRNALWAASLEAHQNIVQSLLEGGANTAAGGQK